MPVCPKCHSEYKEGISRCSDCAVDLVKELIVEKPEHDLSKAGLVEVRTFATTTEGEMIQQLLEQNDIRSLLQGASTGGTLFPAATSVVLLVDERDLEKASELIDAYLESEIAIEDKDIGQPEETEQEEIERQSAEYLKETPVLVVFITVDKKELADKIAESLVEENLAGCVNIVPKIESVYRWEGKVCKEQEILLIAKTDFVHYSLLESKVKQLHTYTVPEIIAFPITRASANYLEWLRGALK
jgi:periplasmic divalent cation tolerance protein